MDSHVCHMSLDFTFNASAGHDKKRSFQLVREFVLTYPDFFLLRVVSPLL